MQCWVLVRRLSHTNLIAQTSLWWRSSQLAVFRAKVGEAGEVKQCGLVGDLSAVVVSEAALQELVGAAVGLEAECGLR